MTADRPVFPEWAKEGPVERPAPRLLELKPANLEDAALVHPWPRTKGIPPPRDPRQQPNFVLRWPDRTKDHCIVARIGSWQKSMPLWCWQAAGALEALRNFSKDQQLFGARLYPEDIAWHEPEQRIANRRWRITYGLVHAIAARRIFEPFDPRLYRLRELEVTKWRDGKLVAAIVRELDGRP